MKKNLFLPVLILVVVMEATAAPEDAALMEKGKAVATETFGLLSAQLLAAIGQGGPTNAIEVCSKKAAELAGKVSAKHGVTVQRVSHKPRHPKNQAGAGEMELIAGYTRALRAQQVPRPQVVAGPESTRIFYAPIIIQLPVCLECHGHPGTDIKPETLRALDRLYAGDQARGFGTNEVRGLWKITFPADWRAE